MPINSDKTHLWKADAARAVGFYNDRLLHFASSTCRKQQAIHAKETLTTFNKTNNLERQQYAMLKRWLLRRGYKQIASDACSSLDAMPAGSFSFCLTSSLGSKTTSYCIMKPADARKLRSPVIITAKPSENLSSSIRSAKKDAKKFAAFKAQQENVKFILLLYGYFDGYYLGPQAAEGIDFVWQHRLDDFTCS